MKKSNLFILCVSLLLSAFTIPYNWDRIVGKAQRDFSTVVTNQIVSKTIDDFLSHGCSRTQLQELNWFARENFLQAHSPWNMEEYRTVAYATFTAWDGKTPITRDSYAYYYFEAGGIDTAIARPFQNFRISIMEIAKEYLSNPDNLASIYKLYKPMLMIKFKDRKDVLIKARTSIELYLSGRSLELSKYDREFLQRREAEGGKIIIQEYYALIDDLIFAI